MENGPRAARPGWRIDTLAAQLRERLDNEAAVVEVLVGALAKGQSYPELWALLHEAARRDERHAELAFVYERLTSERRFKALTGPAQAELLMHVAGFFAEDFGDVEGAIGHLQRVLSISPTHAGAFEKLEGILVAQGDGVRLSELYASFAQHAATKEEQLRLLRRAIELVDGFDAEDERAVRLYQQVLKLDPADGRTRRSLEARYERAGKLAELARMLEQALAAAGADETLDIRKRLVAVYADGLHEMERAMPHVEEVLRQDAGDERARATAEQLLRFKPMAVRAAAALEHVYDRTGKSAEAAQMLCVQIDHLRGPRRLEAQKRLCPILFNRLGDLQGAFAVCEAIVIADPADEEVRNRYRMLAASLDRRAEAVRVLGRAVTGSKDAALKARIGCEVAELCIAIGDVKKGKASYQSVLEAGGDDDALLRAARALARMCTDSRDQRLLAAALERMSDLEPNNEARVGAAERLARLCDGDLHDQKGAIAAWRKLVGTRLEPEALEALQTLYTAAALPLELASVLEKRAAIEPDRGVARATALRAAELWSSSGDRGVALGAWRRFVQTFGPAREAHAAMIPLLEQERLWEELATILMSEAALSPESERVGVLAKLAQLRAARLHDPEGAIDAYRQALAIDRADRASRQAIEKLLATGEQKLAAADVLEPIYRAERKAAEPSAAQGARPAQGNATAGLVRVLEARAELSASARERLAALDEAATLAERELKDPKRAMDLVAQGLKEAAAGDVAAVMRWLERMDRLSAGADASRRASLLAGAFGDQPITHPALAHLARRAGEALALAGDAERALATYRRALAFEPSSPELLARVDSLLREQGSPAERIALYRAALEQPCDRSRRRELLHAIGAIERRDLGDLDAAITTYRRAIAEDPGDRLAHDALLEAYQAAGAWEPLYEELTRGLEGAEGEEQKALILRMAEVAATSGRPDRAAAHYREILRSEGTVLSEAVLDAIERVAIDEKSADLLRDVLERRVSLSSDPRDEATWLERLGDLNRSAYDDAAAALECFRRAAQLLDRADDQIERAIGVWERVLAVVPYDAEAAERLVALCTAAEAWERSPPAYVSWIRAGRDDEQLVARLLAFEPVAVRVRATKIFARTAAELFAKALTPAHATIVRAARARVLAADPNREDEAAAEFRQLIEAGGTDMAPHVETFSAFLDRCLDSPERRADRRWLFEWRVEHAGEGERVRVLLAWAAAEQNVMGDPRSAADLYARILEIDPDHEEAAAARTRLLLALGALDEAATLLMARRDRSEGAARTALDIELAELLLNRLARASEAIVPIAAVLDASPSDANAIALAVRALEFPDARAQAARVLERVVDASEDVEQARGMLERLLETDRGAGDLRPMRRGWFERLLERAPDAAQALEVALRAVRDVPDEPTLWDRAEKLGRELDRPQVIGAVYRSVIHDAAALLREPGALEEVGRRAVEYHEEWFEEPETVVTLLRRIIDADPTASWAFERLKLTYNAAERWDELFQLYDDVLARAPDDRTRAFMLEEAAEAAKDLAGDAERAIGYLEQLITVRRDARAIATLERLYERHGKHRALVDLLSQQLQASLEGENAQRQRARIAAAYIDGLDDPQAACDVIEQMLGIEPNRIDAFELLERVVGLPAARGGDAGQETGGAKQRAAALLKERYRAAGRTTDVLRMLEVELEAIPDKKEHARRLREIVTLRLELEDEQGALESVATLVALEPRVPEHRAELARLAKKTGREDRQADVLASVAETVDDPKLKRAQLIEAMTLYRDVLGDRARATEVALAAFALAKSDDAAALAIARDLEPLLASEQRWAERCDVLERLAALETEPAARRTALGELARAAASLGDPERAIHAWSTRLEHDASDAEALDGLIESLEDRGRWRELLAAIERRAALGDGASARRDKTTAARILSDRLGDIERAIDVWRATITEFGADESSYDELAALLERTGDSQALVTLLEQARTDPAASEARRAAVARRLGDVHRTSTHELVAAVRFYEEALAYDPADPSSRQGLEAIVDRTRSGRAPAAAAIAPQAQSGSPGSTSTARAQTSTSGSEPMALEVAATADDLRRSTLRRAVEALRVAYERSSDETRIVALLDARLEAAADDAERANALRQTAAILERSASPREAFDLLWRSFLLVPEPHHTADVLRLAAAADAWGDVAEAIDELAARPGIDPRLMRELMNNLGVWHRDRRQDPDAAEQAFARAAAFDPSAVEPLAALAELQRRSRGRPLVDTLLRLSDATGGDLALLREAAELAIMHIRDRELSKAVVEKVLQLATVRWLEAGETNDADSAETLLAATGVHATPPADVARWAIEALLRIHQHQGTTERIIDLCLRGARLPFPASERHRLRVMAAELAEPEQAAAIYRQLFEDDPTDELVRERLEQLYQRIGSPDEMLTLRQRQLAITTEPSERAALRLEIGKLCAESGQIERAIATLIKNLEELPTHPDTVGRLGDLYAAAGHHEALAALWEDQAARRSGAEDDTGVAELWARAAVVAETKLGDVERALTAHRRAADAGRVESLDALARLYGARGDHALAAEALDLLRARVSADARADVVLRLADAYVAAGRPETARERLEEAHATLDARGQAGPSAHVREEQAARVRARLADLYRHAELWGALAVLLIADAARAPDRATRIAHLREAAQLHVDHRDDPAAAVPLLEQASELDVDDLELRFELCRALRNAGRAEDARIKLRALVAAYGARRPKERALVHWELAKIALDLGDRAQALAELDVAVKIDPAHPEILAALANLALEEGQLDRAHRTYRALLLVARRSDRDATSVSRAEVLLALSDVAERQGDSERAAEYLDSAFDAARESAVDRERLVRSLRERGRHQTLARALEARLSSPADSAEATAVLTELATLYEEHLGRPDDALAARLRAVSLAPDSATVHEAAVALCRRTGQLERYITTLTRVVDDAADDAQRVKFLVHLGGALEADGYDEERAAAAYTRAEALAGAGDAVASASMRHQIWRALEGIYERLGNAAARATILEKRANSIADADVPAPERADPVYLLASIRLADKARRSEGGELLERAMSIHPEAERAEAILRSAAAADADDDVLQVLERFARATGRRRVLVDALVLRAELLLAGGRGADGDEAPALDLLKEAFALARELDDRALMETILRRVLAESKEAEASHRTLWALLSLAQLREADGDLAEVAALKERAAGAAEPDERRRLILEVAQLAAGPLDDLRRAARLYDGLRRAEPADRQAWEPLAEVYRRLGDSAKLVELIEETVPLVDELSERARLRLEEAKIVLEHDAERGAELLRDILDEDPSQTGAAILLSGMLEKAGRTEELATLLASQLDSAKDREDIASVESLSMRLASLLEQRGADTAALDVYRAALDWNGASADVLSGLLRLTRRVGDVAETAEVIDRLLTIETGAEAAELAIELADMRSRHGDEAGAERALEMGFAAAPESAAVKEQLVARLTARSAWRKLADLHVADAARRQTTEEQVVAVCTAAHVLRQHAGDPRGAADILERARSLVPTDRDVLLALIDAYGAIGEHRRALSALSTALDHNPDDAWLYRTRATVHEALGDEEQALADIERAYDKSQGGFANELIAQLERALSRVAAKTARPRTIPPPLPKPAGRDAPPPSVRKSGARGAAQPRSAPAESASTPAPDREVRLRLAQVLARAGEFDRAREHLADLVRRDAKDRAAMRELANVEEGAKRWDAASAVIRRLLALEEGDALVQTALRLADACEKSERLGDARAGLERALRIAPGNPKVRERLRTVYNVTAASRELAGLILEDAAQAPDVAGRFTMLLHAGRLLVESEDGSGKAVEVLEEARRLRPEEQEITVLLSEAYSTSGRRPEARSLLSAAIAGHKGRRSKALAMLYRAMSRVELGDGNLTDSLNHLYKAFENDPHSSALAMELGLFAIDLDDQAVATRAFRAVTLMKIGPGGSGEGTTNASKALAYYHLGNMARNQGDRRKARLMAEKAVSEDPSLEVAKSLLDELRAR